jgi:mannose-6-phosphate isomerase-like protein (cupin superfamily)
MARENKLDLFYSIYTHKIFVTIGKRTMQPERETLLLDALRAKYKTVDERRGLLMNELFALQRESPEWWTKLAEKAVVENELSRLRIEITTVEDTLEALEMPPTPWPEVRRNEPPTGINIIAACSANEQFRLSLKNVSTTQVEIVLQCLTPTDGNVIGRERHLRNTQVIQCVAGTGSVQIGDRLTGIDMLPLMPGVLVTVPPNTWHEIKNISSKGNPLKFISYYAPAINEPDAVRQQL